MDRATLSTRARLPARPEPLIGPRNRAWRRPPSRNTIEIAIAALLYLGTALVLTWPMPAHITTQVYGSGGDAFGTIGLTREVIDSGVFPFLPGTIDSLGAPEGREWSYPLNVTAWASVGPRWLGSLALGEISAWNLWVLMGYLLTGLSMFLLVRHLTKSVAAGLITGWAYAFYPFAAIRGGSHVDFAYGWPLVLLVWRALELRHNPTRRNGLMAGLALVVCWSFSPYFVLFAAVMLAAIVVVDLLLAWRERALRSHIVAWSSGLWTGPLLLAIYGLVNLTAPRSELIENGIGELYLYSARPLDFIVPVPGSGLVDTARFADEYARGIAMGERGVYMGWTILALALIGIVAVTFRRFDVRRRTAAWIMVVVAAVAFAFSAVPTFEAFGHGFHTPSWYVFQVSPTWRVYARFVIVAMLAACVLAGYGIALIVRGRRWWLAVPLSTVIGFGVISDLYWKSLTPTTTLPDHPIYHTLAASRDDKIAAEYPLVLDIVSDYRYILGQDRHRHRLLNGYRAGTPEEKRAMWLRPLNDPHTAGRLARLGVGWVIVNESDAPPDPNPPGKPSRGFRFMEREQGRALWRVTARPAFSQVFPVNGFGNPEGPAGGQFAWLVEPTGMIRIEASGCSPTCEGTLRLHLASYAVPHNATLRVDDRVIRRVRVGTQPRKLEIPLRVDAKTDVEIDVDGVGRTPRSVDGTPDERTLFLNVTEPEFVRKR